jgi:hypothetical protein
MRTATHAKEAKSRQKVANEKMSKVQQLHRALQSGQLKRELRTVQESIFAARALYGQIESAGIDAKDFRVRVAFLTPDLTTLLTEPFEPGKEDQANAALLKQIGSIPVGLGFAIRDHEKGNWVVGTRLFLSTPLILQAFEQWVNETARLTMNL